MFPGAVILVFWVFHMYVSQISFLLRGGFHLHGYDVTGKGASSPLSFSLSELFVLNALRDKATRACNNADT